MRHADSTDRADPQTKDHERSITDLGRQAAAQVMWHVSRMQCTVHAWIVWQACLMRT